MPIFAFCPVSTTGVGLLIIISIAIINSSAAFLNHNNIRLRPLSIMERTSHASFANRSASSSRIGRRVGKVSVAGQKENEGKDGGEYRKKSQQESQAGEMNYLHMPDRRQLLLSSALSVASLLMPSRPASARGLVQFPVKNPGDLLNTYHFLRVGISLLEEEDDIWTTNPLFLTNREAALSPAGAEQVQAACAELERFPELSPTVIKYSLAASALDSAQIVGNELNLGRDRIVPEFTYLDPRGIGQWDMYRYSTTQPAVWALDATEAGPLGTGGRPPANQDGTPNETLADQTVRLRQVMSILETLYSGETILVIFPDGTGPALLSAMIAGIPLNRVHELEYQPGELRMSINKINTMKILKEKQGTGGKYYEETLAKGRKELARLRDTTTTETLSLKDELLEEDRKEIDKQYQEGQEAIRVEKQQEQARRQNMRVAEQKKRVEKRVESNNNGDSMSNTNPSLAAGAAFGAVGLAGIFAASGGEEAGTKERLALERQKEIDAPSNTTGAPSNTTDASEKQTVAFSPSVTTLDGLETITNEVQSRTLSESSANSDSPQLLTKEDRAKAAEEAMEQYMDRDDGADDWLSTLSQIAQEENDPDGEPNDSGDDE